MSDRIELRGLRLSVIVGALAHERVQPQPLEIDLDLERPLAEAARSDDLAATTNYAEALRAAARAADGAFTLLEALALAVAQAVLEVDPALSAVEVRVRKLRPPVPEDVATVGVSLRVERP